MTKKNSFSDKALEIVSEMPQYILYLFCPFGLLLLVGYILVQINHDADKRTLRKTKVCQDMGGEYNREHGICIKGNILF